MQMEKARPSSPICEDGLPSRSVRADHISGSKERRLTNYQHRVPELSIGPESRK